MLRQTHRDLTTLVCKTLGVQKDRALGIGYWAEWPDHADDLLISGSPSVAGNRLCSLNHFLIPEDMKARGYCAERDGSIKGIRALIPEVPIQVNPAPWKVGRGDPLYTKLHGKIASKVTYLSLVELNSLVGRSNLSADAKLGIRTHLLCDALMWHHTRGLLLDGHSAYEGSVQEAFARGPWHQSGVIPEAPRWAGGKVNLQLIAEWVGARRSPISPTAVVSAALGLVGELIRSELA